MSELSMTPEQRDALLDQPHVAILAVARPEGPPLVTPVWYRYVDGELRFGTSTSTAKAQLLDAAGRATMCVQREEAPPAYVTVDGPVRFEECTPDALRPIVERYLPPEAVDGFLAGSPDDVIVTLRPARWFSADFGKVPG